MKVFNCGLNFCNELKQSGDEVSNEFKEIPLEYKSTDFLINSGSFFQIHIFNDVKKFKILSSICPNLENTVDFKENIQDVEISNDCCFFLHKNSTISIYNVLNKEFEKNECVIPFDKTSERIAHISCTLKSLFAVTNLNCLYQLQPEFMLISEFPKHQKIKKIKSGYEHTLLLTQNGDVFSFGCSLRGQCGHGDVNFNEKPKLVEAVSGLKIIDIGCGCFHSALLSSFNDVYSFGWNTNGQLGIEKVIQGKFISETNKYQQVFTLPQLIEIDDDFEEITNIECGSKHMILKTSNRLFSVGLNNYGQLGIGSNDIDNDKITEIPFKLVTDSLTKIFLKCGFYNTFLIKKSVE